MDKQESFADNIRAEALKAGSFKSIGDVIELPDKEDWQNICRIINKTRKLCIAKYGFDILVDCIATAKKERGISGYRYGRLTKEFNLVNKDSNMRLVFELPEDFVRAITEVYPVMFTNKKHFAWFAKNFKTLRLVDKY